MTIDIELHAWEKDNINGSCWILLQLVVDYWQGSVNQGGHGG